MSRVDQVVASAQKTMLLLQKGIVFSTNPGQGVTYQFTGLNSIKPNMITEATRNARAAATRFAVDWAAKWVHRQANQGVFSILAADQGGDGGEGGGNFGGDSSVMKTVRVSVSAVLSRPIELGKRPPSRAWTGYPRVAGRIFLERRNLLHRRLPWREWH